MFHSLSFSRLPVLFLAMGTAAAFTLPVLAGNPERANLTVRVQGLNSNQGQVIARVFRSAQGFPGQPERALRSQTVPVQRGQAVLRFADLPAGSYAVAVAHDQNNNGELDFNVLGIPSEGVGFSNNPRLLFGPPAFDVAAVWLREDRSIAIKAVY